VRTVQPVLATLPHELEEAAATLGARRAQTFGRVVFPIVLPGAADRLRARVRARDRRVRLGDLHRGNMPMVSEITPLVIVTKLEQYDYSGRDRDRRRDARRVVRAAARRSTCCRRGRAGGSARRCDGGAASSPWLRARLIASALAFLARFLFVPLAFVFVEALQKGLDVVRGARSPIPTRSRRSG
jgi:hypothetical protein